MRKILIKMVLRFFALLPLPLNHALGASIGWLLYHLHSNFRKTGETNISRCFPGLSKSEQNKLVCDTLKQTAKTLTEMGPLWHWPLKRLQSKVAAVHNMELLANAAKSGRGVLCLTPHYGCWEICSLHFADHYPAVCLYRPPRQKALADYIKITRERFGTTLVPTTPAGIKQLYMTLNQGRIVGLLPDQDPGKNSGIYTTFFGLPCNTMPLVSKLIRKTDPVVLFLYATRLPHGQGFEILIEPFEHDFKNLTNEAILNLMNQSIEKTVKKMPAQYQWTYKRFKYQPDNVRFYG